MKRSEEENMKKKTWRQNKKNIKDINGEIEREEKSEEEIRHRIKTKRKDNKDNK